jgi:hypothetical protein
MALLEFLPNVATLYINVDTLSSIFLGIQEWTQYGPQILIQAAGRAVPMLMVLAYFPLAWRLAKKAASTWAGDGD